MKFTPWVLAIILAALVLLVLKNKNNEIENLNQQLAIANQEINKANKVIAVATLPEATVSIGFREAMMGAGSVAVISNTSDENIPVSVLIKRVSTGQTKNYDFVMNARSSREIGHMDGWAFVSGDAVEVKQPKHKTRIVSLR